MAASASPSASLLPSDVALPGRGPGTFRVYQTPPSAALTSHVIAMHGAGLTSLSFAALAQALPKTVGVWAYDCRGHGATTVEPEEDWSLETLVKDAQALLEQGGWMRPDAPPCFLLGHSMGGCIAARVAWKGLKGLIVLDAVEGVALSATDSGVRFLDTRPVSFKSVNEAIDWSLSYGPLRGPFSAKISVPDQLVHMGEAFVWRTNLRATVPYWREWFTGLSATFLSAPCPKLLVLAGVEKLDTPLAAGHMMGKYQLVVMSTVAAGHFVHEDAPGQTAGAISLFISRQQLSAPKAGLTAEEVLALRRSQG